MKTYVLMLAKTFPHDHPRAGQETHFAEKYLSGEKIHTIRANTYLWKKREEMMAIGKAVLSIRQWEDKPYRSKQIEIAKIDNINVERITAKEIELLDIDELANNDGLSRQDFEAWFKGKSLIGMGIIHFQNNFYAGKSPIHKMLPRFKNIL
jgi:hypothetical protein